MKILQEIVCHGCEKNSIYVESNNIRKNIIALNWRVHRGYPYCIECRNKGMGGKNAIKINGLWYTEKELQQYIEKMP